MGRAAAHGLTRLRAGIDILTSYGHVEEAYGLSPTELNDKIKHFDALIIRSSTQVCPRCWRAHH